MDYCDILLYCDLSTLAANETWKHPSGKILQFGLPDEIVRDYVVLAEIGGKVVAYCNVEEAQAARIVQHIEGNPDLGHKSWSCYDSLLLDPDYQAIAEQVFRHPVEREIEIMDSTLSVRTFMSVSKARALGASIDPERIAIPHQWAGTA